MLNKEISAISLLKEDTNQGVIAVHRTENCVLYSTIDNKRSSPSSNCGFKSEIGKAFKPHGILRQVTPIFHKISNSFFETESISSGKQLPDGKDSYHLNKIRKQTEGLKAKLNAFRAHRDPYIKDIKDKICNTNRRLKQSKAGTSLDASIALENSFESAVVTTQVNDEGKIHRKKVIEYARNLPFEKKLEFYDEDFVSAERRLKTSHFPWDQPIFPALPSTPENSEYYPKMTNNAQHSIRRERRSSLSNRIELEFLKEPKLLGIEGNKLLLQMIEDEKKNVRTSNAEIEQLNLIIRRRRSKLQATENGWQREMLRYAVDKVNLVPTCDPAYLIKSYFRYFDMFLLSNVSSLHFVLKKISFRFNL